MLCNNRCVKVQHLFETDKQKTQFLFETASLLADSIENQQIKLTKNYEQLHAGNASQVVYLRIPQPDGIFGVAIFGKIGNGQCYIARQFQTMNG